MQPVNANLGMTVQLKADFETAQARVVDALKAEGFGVLTQIDVKETMKQKLDVDFRPYRILGACNPHLAHRALSAVPQMGLLLPCNVTLSQAEEGVVEVSIVDPLAMMSVIDHEELKAVADEAHERLARVVRALEV